MRVHKHPYTGTRSGFSWGTRAPQSQISHRSQLRGEDTGRVNLITEDIRPRQAECLLLCPWDACKFQAEFNRCCTVAAHHLDRDINCKGRPFVETNLQTLSLALMSAIWKKSNREQPVAVGGSNKNRPVNLSFNWGKQHKHTRHTASRGQTQISCKQVIGWESKACFRTDRKGNFLHDEKSRAWSWLAQIRNGRKKCQMRATTPQSIGFTQKKRKKKEKKRKASAQQNADRLWGSSRVILNMVWTELSQQHSDCCR